MHKKISRGFLSLIKYIKLPSAGQSRMGALGAVLVVLNGCATVPTVVYEIGKSLSPKVELPKLGYYHSGGSFGDPLVNVRPNLDGYAQFGEIGVYGSMEKTLREAAKRGADAVSIRENDSYMYGSKRRGYTMIKVIEARLFRYDPPQAYWFGFQDAMGHVVSNTPMNPARVKVFLDLEPSLAKRYEVYFLLVKKLRPSGDRSDRYNRELYEQPESILEVVKLLVAAGADLNAKPKHSPHANTPKTHLLPGVQGYPMLLQLVEDSLRQPMGQRARKVLMEVGGLLKGGKAASSK